jgi:hypothetical protein
MSVSPFDIVKNISEKTELEFEVTDYTPYIVNRALSMFKDTIFIANEANKMGNMGKDQQYQFYMNIVEKGKRYAKWEKAEKDSDDVEMLKTYFTINSNIARQYLQLLDNETLEVIRTKMVKGGNHVRDRSEGKS